MAKTLKAHVLPLTNCSFNKNGDKYLIKNIGLLQAATIEPVKYGIHNLEIFYINYKAIKMQFIHWLLTCLTGIF